MYGASVGEGLAPAAPALPSTPGEGAARVLGVEPAATPGTDTHSAGVADAIGSLAPGDGEGTVGAEGVCDWAATALTDHIENTRPSANANAQLRLIGSPPSPTPD